MRETKSSGLCERHEVQARDEVQQHTFLIIRFVIPVVFSKINWNCVYICLTQL